MVHLIIGQKGSGKTKRLVKLASDALNNTNGNVVFIDDDTRCMPELNYRIRFINSTEYAVRSVEEIYGFIAGLLAGNYDIQKIYIDGLYNVSSATYDEVAPFVKRLNKLCENREVEIYMTLSETSGSLPADLSEFIMEELKVE